MNFRAVSSLFLLVFCSPSFARMCGDVEFDPAAYYLCNPDVEKAMVDACEHYINNGKKENRKWDCEETRSEKKRVTSKSSCRGLPFNKSAYLICNPDVADAGVDPCDHYANFRAAENRRWDCDAALPNDGTGTANVPATSQCGGNPFNISAYLICQRDIAELDVDACSHYLNNGMKEGRRWNCEAAKVLPGASDSTGSSGIAKATVPATEKCDGEDFNSKAYLLCHTDVAKAGVNACSHYVNNGRAEKRKWDCPEAVGGDYTSDPVSPPVTPPVTIPVTPAVSSDTSTGSYDEDKTYAPINADSGDKELYVQNDKIKVGVWRSHGAAITYLGHPEKYNGVNNSDLGRQLQSAIYSQPVPYVIPGKDTHPEWKNVGWNPIEAGDIYLNPTPVEVMAKSSDGKTIYTRTRPLQWASRNVPGEIVLEKWITLVGGENGAHVHYRYHVNRADTTKYLARQQEFPCLYTVGAMYKFVGYFGDQPFSRAKLDVIGMNDRADKGLPVFPTEAWMGVIDDDNYGVGLFMPDGSMKFTKNYFSPAQGPEIERSKDTKSFHSGYISHAPMSWMRGCITCPRSKLPGPSFMVNVSGQCGSRPCRVGTLSGPTMQLRFT